MVIILISLHTSHIGFTTHLTPTVVVSLFVLPEPQEVLMFLLTSLTAFDR